MKKKASEASKFFTGIAAKGWHGSPFFTYTWKYPALRRWIAAQLRPEGRRVLSIGCGSGEIERDLGKSGARVVGIDISHAMLRAASRRGLRSLVQADAERLPFRDGSFDAVAVLEAFGYIEAGPTLAEAKRVLKRHGQLIVTAYPPQLPSDGLYQKRTLQEIAGELRRAGFRILDQRMLAVGRAGVTDAASEQGSVLLFALSEKR